jgi:hypothetical protein
MFGLCDAEADIQEVAATASFKMETEYEVSDHHEGPDIPGLGFDNLSAITRTQPPRLLRQQATLGTSHCQISKVQTIIDSVVDVLC